MSETPDPATIRALIEEARQHDTNEDGRCDTCMEWWTEFDSNGKASRGHAIASAYPCLSVRLADMLAAQAERLARAEEELASERRIKMLQGKRNAELQADLAAAREQLAEELAENGRLRAEHWDHLDTLRQLDQARAEASALRAWGGQR